MKKVSNPSLDDSQKPSIERLRASLEISQKSFAERIKVPLTTYERWTRGGKMRLTIEQWYLLGLHTGLLPSDLLKALEPEKATNIFKGEWDASVEGEGIPF